MKYKNNKIESTKNNFAKKFNIKYTEKYFHFKELKIEINSNVYEPAEDTFSLLESIKINKGDKVLEIGTGCGIIALECARLGADVICVDLNPYSIKLVKHNNNINKKILKGSFQVRYSNLFSSIKKDEKFNVIIFNPPYLPTLKEDLIEGNGWFDVAIDGGYDGLKLTKPFIESLNDYLKINGHAYFVFSSLSNRKKLNNLFKNNKLKSEIIKSSLFDNEKIDVYRVQF